jgi:hypothetical protein
VAVWLDGARSGETRNRSGDGTKPSPIRNYESSFRSTSSLRPPSRMAPCRSYHGPSGPAANCPLLLLSIALRRASRSSFSSSSRSSWRLIAHSPHRYLP